MHSFGPNKESKVRALPQVGVVNLASPVGVVNPAPPVGGVNLAPPVGVVNLASPVGMVAKKVTVLGEKSRSKFGWVGCNLPGWIRYF